MKQETKKQANDRAKAEARFRKDRAKLYAALEQVLDHAVESDAYRYLVEEEQFFHKAGSKHLQQVGECIAVTVTGVIEIMLNTVKGAVP